MENASKDLPILPAARAPLSGASGLSLWHRPAASAPAETVVRCDESLLAALKADPPPEQIILQMSTRAGFTSAGFDTLARCVPPVPHRLVNSRGPKVSGGPAARARVARTATDAARVRDHQVPERTPRRAQLGLRRRRALGGGRRGRRRGHRDAGELPARLARARLLRRDGLDGRDRRDLRTHKVRAPPSKRAKDPTLATEGGSRLRRSLHARFRSAVGRVCPLPRRSRHAAARTGRCVTSRCTSAASTPRR